METQSVKNIRSLKEKIEENIDSYRKIMRLEPNIDLNTPQFGQESEYSINGIIGGVKNILTDISFLVNSHVLFIKISTLEERRNIATQLSNLNNYIGQRDHKSIVVTIDNLKVCLRPYNLRLDKNRFLEFNNEIDSLRRKAILLEEDIKLIKERIKESDEIYGEIQSSKKSFDDILGVLFTEKELFVEKVNEFKEKYNDFSNLAEQATINESLISSKLEDVEKSEVVFDEFIQKIDSREKLLLRQDAKFAEYDDIIFSFNKEQSEAMSIANDLIEESKKALGYTTANSLSTAFSKKYDESNHWSNTLWWLLGAGFFILATLGLGIWILVGWGIDSTTDTIIKIVGRLSLIPFTLLAALFCANQYIKQKNIIEDYAYKSVLAKSMIAFSEELRKRDNERYAEYISTVLKEIHQDPLRKRGDKEKKDDISLSDSMNTFSKIIELVKPIIKQ